MLHETIVLLSGFNVFGADVDGKRVFLVLSINNLVDFDDFEVLFLEKLKNELEWSLNNRTIGCAFEETNNKTMANDSNEMLTEGFAQVSRVDDFDRFRILLDKWFMFGVQIAMTL